MVLQTYVDECLQRMRVWMELRELKPNPVYTYLGCARRFIEGVSKPLEAIDGEDVRQYMLALVRGERSPRTRNVNLGAIRVLLRATLGRDPSTRSRGSLTAAKAT